MIYSYLDPSFRLISSPATKLKKHQWLNEGELKKFKKEDLEGQSSMDKDIQESYPKNISIIKK